MRKLVPTLALIVVVGGIVAFGGRKAYRAWKTEKALAAAQKSLVAGDLNKASLWLRQAISGDANHTEAIRLMGDLAERSQSPNAVYWRTRLVEVEPKNAANRYILARAALVHRDYGAAKSALEGLSAGERTSSEFFRITGAMAVASGELAAAERQFGEALRLNPTNSVLRLNLAMIRVQRIEPSAAAEARKELEQLRHDPALSLDATRHLVHDAVRHTNYARAVLLVQDLASNPKAYLIDRLLELDVLQLARHPQLDRALAAAQREATTNANTAFELGRWMLKGVGVAGALSWLQTVPASLRTNLPLTMVMADAHLASSNWPALQSWVGYQSWGELDYLRLAFSTRALREQSLGNAGKVEWSQTLKATEGRLERLQSLQRVLKNWSWHPELEEVLWMIVSRYPKEKETVVTLAALLHATGKTRSLLTLYAQEAKLDPKNPAIKNNLAALALLLNAMEHHPHELARAAYESNRVEPSIVSTYAYSLHLLNKSDEALRIMSTLKPAEIEQPGVAGYYGLLVAATGDRNKANYYLKLALTSRLLPEEVQLFERVRM